MLLCINSHFLLHIAKYLTSEYKQLQNTSFLVDEVETDLVRTLFGYSFQHIFKGILSWIGVYMNSYDCIADNIPT